MTCATGAAVWLWLVAAAGPVPAPDRAATPPPSPTPLVEPARDPLLAFASATDRGPGFASAVAAAVARAPSVAEAVAVVAEATGVRHEVRAGRLPRVDIDIGGQQVISRDFANDPANILERSRPERRADAAVTAEQTLFDFGAGLNRLRAARARQAAARAEVEVTAGDAAERAAGAWYDLYLAGARVDLARVLVDRHVAILGDTRSRIASGVGAAGDVARVEAYLAGASGQRARAEQGEIAARLRYREAFGVDAPARLGRPQPLGTIDGGFAAALEAARGAPAALVARARIEAAARDLASVRADRYPRLVAGLDAAKYSLFTDQVDHDIRGRLSIRQRLYGGGASEGRAEQAAARLRQSEFAEQRVIEEGARSAGVAFRDVEALDRQAAIARAGYVAGRRTRDLYVEQYRVARGSLLELLRAEADLHDAAVGYLGAVAASDVARYTLLARTGGILARFDIEITTP